MTFKAKVEVRDYDREKVQGVRVTLCSSDANDMRTMAVPHLEKNDPRVLARRLRQLADWIEEQCESGSDSA